MKIFYTYLIGWKLHNKYYYGVRYSKNANTQELWVTYFTSSKYVKEFRALYGEPDIVQIRRTFLKREKAQIWETKVLRRLKVVKNDMWLNKTDNKSIDYDLGCYGAMIGCKLGAKITNEIRWKNKQTSPTKKYIKPGIFSPYEKGIDGRKIRKNRYWFNNGIVEGQFSLENHPPMWLRGRIKKL